MCVIYNNNNINNNNNNNNNNTIRIHAKKKLAVETGNKASNSYMHILYIVDKLYINKISALVFTKYK